MFSGVKVLSEEGLVETLLTSKAHVKRFRAVLTADTRHDEGHT